MKTVRLTALLNAVIAAGLAFAAAGEAKIVPEYGIVAAEQAGTQWVIIDPAKESGYEWSWSPVDDPNIGFGPRSADYCWRFTNPSDVRPSADGKLLVISSAGGFARIDIARGTADYWGVCDSQNPHSITELPDGRVACATSDGNGVVLIDPREHPLEPWKQQSRKVLALEQGHGVVWDAQRKVLWALGATAIVELEYLPDEMNVREKARYDFIADGCGKWGHDLLFDDDRNLVFTTHETVSKFDVAAHRFTVLDRTPAVKGIDFGKSGTLRCIPREKWWTDTLRVGDREVTRKGAKFYKARYLRAPVRASDCIRNRAERAAANCRWQRSALKTKASLADYASHVRNVNGTNVWTAALQKALDEREIVTIPAREEPYWIDAPVLVPSKRRIEAAGATVSLLPGTRTLMLRNVHAPDGTLKPVSGRRDDNISIVGGRWTDWTRKRAGYGKTGCFDLTERKVGNHFGVSTLFYFGNCNHVSVQDATFANCSAFAVQAGDGDAHVYERIRFDDCYADGLHLNGNLTRVLVRDVKGKVGDDLVALNAYDWLNSSVNFGPQQDICCEDLELVLKDGQGYPAIRIQPAKFRYADGSVVDCAISDVVFRRVKGIMNFKMYLQTPGYTIGKEPEWAEVGSGGNLHFEDIDLDLEHPIDNYGQYASSDPLRGHFGAFEFGANLSSVSFRDVRIRFHADKWPLSHLMTVGPKSMDLGKYEVFDPYVTCRVERVTLENVTTSGVVPKELVHATEFHDINKDGRSSGRGVIGEIVTVGAAAAREDAEKLWDVFGCFGKVTGEATAEGKGFSCTSGGCRVETTVADDASGVSVRRTVVRNASDRPLVLNCLLDRFLLGGGEFEVYTQASHWQHESRGAWQRLNTCVAARGNWLCGSSGAAPVLAVWDEQAGRGRAFHLLSDGAWEMQAVRIPCGGENTYVAVEVGVDSRHLAYSLKPGEAVALPEVVSYDFTSKLDLDCHRLHAFWNARHPAVRPLPTVYNSWLCRFDKLDFDFVLKQVEKAKTLGADYFVLDAGWFGPKAGWWTVRGDWEERADGNLGGRMAEVSKAVRAAGMRFGFWVEAECADDSSRVLKEHPDWFFTRGHQHFLDFRNPAAFEYLVGTVSALLRKYEGSYVKFDFNQNLDCDPSGRAFIDYNAAYRRFLQEVRRRNPGVYLEGCASGGNMMNLGWARDFDSFWLSDNQSPYHGLRIVRETMLRLPPRFIERWLVARTAEGLQPDYEGHDARLLACDDATWKNVRSVTAGWLDAFAAGGPVGFSCDLTAFSPADLARLKAGVAARKADVDFWRRAVGRVLCDTPSVLALQYDDGDLDDVRVVVAANRLIQSGATVRPVLRPGADYRLGDAVFTADHLSARGVDVELASHDAKMLRLVRVR